MAWQPKFGWKRGGARADATPADDTQEDELEDEVLETDDEDDTPADEPVDDAPAASSDAALKAENERLKAENAKLSAQAGTKTLDGAKAGALKSAVRLFGQGTPKLKQAKQLLALASTPDEADAFRSAWDLAFGATSLAGLGGVRQITTIPVADADKSAVDRAAAAVARTRSVK